MITSRLVLGAALALVGSAGFASAQYTVYRSAYSYPQVNRPIARSLLLGAGRIALSIGTYPSYGYGYPGYGYGGFPGYGFGGFPGYGYGGYGSGITLGFGTSNYYRGGGNYYRGGGNYYRGGGHHGYHR